MASLPQRNAIEVPSTASGILLHCCCAPCSGAIVEWMVQNGLRPVIFFSNANIFPKEEYVKRREEIVRYAALFDLEVIDDEYGHDAWLEAVRGLENEPERGARCAACFRFRLLRAARYAAEHGFDTLTTTLASSRWKDLEQVGAAGEWACGAVAAELAASGSCLRAPFWWNQNWRKGGLQPRRDAIIREQDFYNQIFCGCEFCR